MAVITIRNIDGITERRLRARATLHGRSVEDEARDILRSALTAENPDPRDLASAIAERLGELGGVDLSTVPRDAIRRPATSHAHVERSVDAAADSPSPCESPHL